MVRHRAAARVDVHMRHWGGNTPPDQLVLTTSSYSPPWAPFAQEKNCVAAPWRTTSSNQVVCGHPVQGAALESSRPEGLGQRMGWAGLITALTACQLRAGAVDIVFTLPLPAPRRPTYGVQVMTAPNLWLPISMLGDVQVHCSSGRATLPPPRFNEGHTPMD